MLRKVAESGSSEIHGAPGDGGQLRPVGSTGVERHAHSPVGHRERDALDAFARSLIASVGPWLVRDVCQAAICGGHRRGVRLNLRISGRGRGRRGCRPARPPSSVRGPGCRSARSRARLLWPAMHRTRPTRMPAASRPRRRCRRCRPGVCRPSRARRGCVGDAYDQRTWHHTVIASRPKQSRSTSRPSHRLLDPRHPATRVALRPCHRRGNADLQRHASTGSHRRRRRHRVQPGHYKST